METNKYPTRYFLLLLLFLGFGIVFWSLLFDIFKSENFNSVRSFSNRTNNTSRSETEYWEQDYIPDNISEIITIDTSKIIIDSLNQRNIVSNILNIAIKNTSNSIAKFANEFKTNFPSDKYKIIYIDSVVNRLQIELPEEERTSFKTVVKQKLNNYKLLIWDEILFDYVKTYNDPKLKDDNFNWYLKVINIDKAWNQTTGDKKIVIAVIDNGFDLNHPELKNKAVKPYNVLDKSTDVSPNKENHGTHVASTIVATGDNNQGLLGICPDCSFMPIKVADQNDKISNTYVIDAILYAIKNNADVINLSLGMQIPMNIGIPLQDQLEYIKSDAKDEEEFWQDLFDYANQRNITCVIAAGNSNMLTGFDPFQRSKNTIKVGAVNKNLEKATFSNYGENTTIYAPGTNIFGAKPNNNYEILQGTSMAAPIISGFIGLIKSKSKSVSNQEIISILNRNSTNKGSIKILNISNSIN